MVCAGTVAAFWGCFEDGLVGLIAGCSFVLLFWVFACWFSVCMVGFSVRLLVVMCLVCVVI